jgi:transposase
VNKNDPNDARSVAIAALRSAGVREVRADDHAAVLKIWSKRHRDLGRTRTQVVCRLHAVLGELIPGGVPKVITTARAARVLRALRPEGAVEAARCELAGALLDDLRRVDVQLGETRKKLAVTVAAAGTSLTGLFGVGPVIAAIVIGDVREVSRFPGRDHFAAYNGTAPIEVSSGRRKVYRLSRRGNRRLNHAIHMAAITQIRYRHSRGRAYYDKKLAEGKTGKEALRALKRQVSNAIFACLQADARRSAARAEGPGGQQGNGSVASAAGLHPRHRLFGQATPGPVHHTTTAAGNPPPSPAARAYLAIPRSLPPCRWRSRRSSWSARSEVNRPGESGDLVCCLAGLGEGGILTVVGMLEFGGRNVSAGLIEAPVVEPVGVLQGGELDLPGGSPGSAGFDQLGLEQPDDGLGQGVVVGVAGGPG